MSVRNKCVTLDKIKETRDWVYIINNFRETALDPLFNY